MGDLIYDMVDESYFAAGGIVIGKLIKVSFEYSPMQFAIQVAWDRWESAGKPCVSGIEEDLRLDKYLRGYAPYLLTQRTLDRRRGDIPEILRREGLLFFDQFDYMCRHFGLTGDDPFVFARGVSYYTSPVRGISAVPSELLIDLPRAFEYPEYKRNFDAFITGGYNLRDAAARGFSEWLDTIHQIDNDLGLMHPYTFDDTLWTAASYQ